MKRRSHDSLPMSAAYFRLVLREHGTTPALRARLLEGTAVRESMLAEAGAEVTLGQFLRLVRNANRVLEPGWDLATGNVLHASTHGPVGFATVSAPTLGESLGVIARFGHVRAPFYRIRTATELREHRVVIEPRVRTGAAEWAVIANLLLLSGQGLVESVLGRRMREARFELPFPEPAHVEHYEKAYHAPVYFGCPAAALVVPRAWLDVECPLADPEMYRTAIRSLETGDRRLDGRSFTVARVEQMIASRGEALDVESTARALGTSRRTLVRRLRAGGASFRDLAQAELRRRAEALLRDREMSLAEVAFALGYEDAANFGRACRRWFGMSPGRAREQLARSVAAGPERGGRAKGARSPVTARRSRRG